MPDIVEFYTGRPPILKNVPTYVCRKPDDLAYVLEHLAELVVKQVHGSGGYGMLVGPDRHAATRSRCSACWSRRAPTATSPSRRWRSPPARRWSSRASPPRHLDLRPLRAGGRPRAADARAASRAWRCARARWWSTPARAAAPRTPGCCKDSMYDRTPHAGPHRQRPVLDVALHRARREHGAPAGGRLSHRAAAARGRTARTRSGARRCAAPAARRATSPSTAPTTRAMSSTSCCSMPTTPRASIPASPRRGATPAPSARR